jgi:Tfp pilus assembly protein PilX
MLNQRGIALPLTLMIVMALMALTMALLSYAAFEPVLSRNLAENTQARFAAEAGLERALDILSRTRNWDTVLVGAGDGVGVTLLPTSPIGNLPATRGTFTVNVRNDTLAADAAITGVTKVEGSPTVDQNAAVIVTATGTVGTGPYPATKVLQAAIKRPTPLDIPAALNFPGNEAEVRADGNSFEVSGNGWNMDGTADASCASRYGIAVSTVLPSSNPGVNEGKVEGALASNQMDNVKGKQQPDAPQPGPQGQGKNTIARDPNLTPQMIQSYIDQAKQVANIKLESKQPSGLSFSNIGDSCGTDPSSQTCWGTAEDPKVVWIKGDPDPSSQFSALQLSGGTVGYGVLIVEDGDLRVSGNFTWIGPIIVTGKWVGVGYLGGGNQQVYGAVISNETATDPGFMEGVVTGNAKIRYSCKALDLANSALIRAHIVSWKDVPQ